MKGNRETLISQQQFLFQKNIGKRIQEEQCLIEQIDRLGDTYLDDNVELYSVPEARYNGLSIIRMRRCFYLPKYWL